MIRNGFARRPASGRGSHSAPLFRKPPPTGRAHHEDPRLARGRTPPRKLIADGPAGLSDAELLAVLLGSGKRGCTAVDLARKLLDEFGSLRELLSANRARCLDQLASGPRATPPAGGAGARAPPLPRSARAVSPALAAPADHARLPARAAARQALRGVLLPVPGQSPPPHRLRGAVPRHHRRRQRPPPGGGARGAAHNAAAVIFAHNHPSGVAEPSQADELITRRLKEALALVDVRVLDHLIVGESRCVSFAERGLL